MNLLSNFSFLAVYLKNEKINKKEAKFMYVLIRQMNAELQVLSPLVPLCSLKFLRFCKQHADGVWAVVDVSIDINREATNANSYLHSRRLPSGCLVQDMPDGYSKVIAYYVGFISILLSLFFIHCGLAFTGFIFIEVFIFFFFQKNI